MKILFLSDGIYPFQIGGMQKHSLKLCEALIQEKNIQIDLCHCGGKDYNVAAFNTLFNGSEQIKEIYIPFPTGRKIIGHYIRANKLYAKTIYEKVKDQLNTYDFIYAQGFTAWELLSPAIKPNIKAKIAVNLHGYEMFQKQASLKSILQSSMLKIPVKKIIKEADIVYSFGPKIDDILVQIGVQRDRITQQLNGIDDTWLINEPKPIHHPIQFLFIGRAERRKGIEELNIALNSLRNSTIKWSMHFIGPVPQELKIDAENIAYHGEIRDTEKIISIVDQSDCLVCPSYAEGMPTVILEAMSRGLMIIATDVGGVSKQIDNNGILLPSPAPQLIEKAMLKILNTENDQLMNWKTNSVKKIKTEFLWKNIASRFIEEIKV
jgi:glycosyltransferase involved in cell wall biosynthesis